MPDDEEKTVPYQRFQQINDKLSAAQLRIDELEPKLASVATLEQQLAQSRAKLASVEETAEIYKHGVTDPEAVTVARALHAALPEDGRPALPAWLGALKGDPTKAPKALQPYFAQPVPAVVAQPAMAPATAPTAPVPTKPAAPPIAAGGAVPGPPPGGKVTAQDLAATRGTKDHESVMAAWRAEKGLPPKRAKS